jgi:dTDP-4-dehydrorhamnose 3,5-epimerase
MRYNISMKIDKTIEESIKDIKTTFKDGSRLESVISGVIKNRAVVHSDHRGRLFEVYSGQDEKMWVDPVVYCYMFSIRVNQIKGWGLHLLKDDRYTLIKGESLTVLYDAREDSETYGAIQKVILSEQGDRQLLIPKGVWHINVNISESETLLINHPTTVYDHDAPDRYLLPSDTDKIPFDLKEMFPKQYNA